MSSDLTKENGFTWKKKKARSERYPIETFTDADDLVNIPDYLLHNLKQGARSIGLFVNLDKNDFICFNQYGGHFLVKSKPLKLINQFIDLGGNISSTESDIYNRISKS